MNEIYFPPSLMPVLWESLKGVKIIRYFTLYCGWIIEGVEVNCGLNYTLIFSVTLLPCNFLPGKSRKKVIIGSTNCRDLVIKSKTLEHFLNCLVSKAGHKYKILKPPLHSLKLQKSPAVRNSLLPVSKYVNIILILHDTCNTPTN